MTPTETRAQDPQPDPSSREQRELIARWMAVEAAARDEDEDEPDHAPRSALNGHLVVGLIALVVGVLITVVTYQSASSAGGGSYVVAYGPIIYGVISIFRGLAG